jgi:signal transduction histidine kinase
MGCLFVRPEHGLMKNFSSDNYGGVVLRRILPIVIIIPLVLGWFKLYAEKIFLFSNEFGVSVVAIGNLVVTGSLVYILAIYLNRLDAKRKQVEEQIKDNQDNLRSLTSRLSSKEEGERKHIAECIHDSIIQPLIFLDVKIKSLLMTTKNNEMIESFEQMRRILTDLIEKSRTVTFDLSYPILYELGLAAGIEEWLQTEIRDKHDMTVSFRTDIETRDLDQNLVTFLFKSVKELLINVVKHAKANNVSVFLAREQNSIMLCVEDDGCGFGHDSHKTKSGKMSGFGLFNIHEKMVYLGGNFRVQSKPGVGSKIVLTIPLESKP